MTKNRRFPLTWVVYALWAIFVNAVDQWILGPLAQDFAFIGVVAVLVLGILWVSSIPRPARRKWITFTLFSLLFGQGLSNIAFYPLSTRIPFGLLMFFGLVGLTWWFGRVRLPHLVTGAVVLLMANAWLPVSEWPFLTHFQVAYYNQLRFFPTDMPSLPFAPVTTPQGRALVSVQNLQENTTAFEKSAYNATNSPTSLADVLRNYKHRYGFVELTQSHGRFSLQQVDPQTLAKVNPMDLVGEFFPFTKATWTVSDGKAVQYMVPSQSPAEGVAINSAPGDIPRTIEELAQHTAAQEQADWQNMLSDLGVQSATHDLHISDSRLVGTVNGLSVNVPVSATSIVAVGSFTASNQLEVLVRGTGFLQVVSLSGGGKVVSTYAVPPGVSLVNDIKTGPIDNSGRDAILVNESPAFILQAESSNQWTKLYTAPNTSLRFEGAARFPGDKTPEIITDDPSYLRETPTRYFTSYTYDHGQLVRNWRVFRTNVVNVHAMQFTPGGDTYIVASIFATGKFLVLKRHDIPVVPLACAGLGVVMLAGWGIRLKKRGGKHHA